MRKVLAAVCVLACTPFGLSGAPAADGTTTTAPPGPVFDPVSRSVTGWRAEAAANLVSASVKALAVRSDPAPDVARCVKLNNYWCIKSAGWDGEISADGEGHVAFASAAEGAAVAAILLKRYYVDFGRRTSRAIIERWAPARCGLPLGAPPPFASIRRSITEVLAPIGIGGTLRAHWLASHIGGFARPIAGRRATVRRSTIADPSTRLRPAPRIAVGIGARDRAAMPMTLDALMMASPGAAPSRSMIGMPNAGRPTAGSLSACGSDEGRVAAYAAKAAAGLTLGPNGDLVLFDADGRPTANLATIMANMARVEIGPDGATPALIQEGIARAFRPGRNPRADR